MRQVEGRISGIEGGLATVEVTISEGGCGRCHEPGGCGASNISRALGAKSRFLVLENTLNLKIGDPVTVGVDDESISAIATRVYALPLLGVIAGGAVGEFWVGGDGSVAAIIGAATGFFTAIAFGRYLLPATAPRPRMMDAIASTCAGRH